MEATPKYNYNIEKADGLTKIKYKKTPITYKAAFSIAPFMVMPSIIVCYFLFNNPNSNATITRMAVFFIGIIFFLSFLIVLIFNLFRRPSSITISSDAIIKNGKSYSFGNISSFLIQDPFGVYETTIVTQGTGINGGLQQIGASSRAAFKRQLKEVGYKICLRYGSKNITIASGLSEVHAETLMQKISELTGFQPRK